MGDGAGRSRLTGPMTPEERAKVVVALDHDARQPQHAAEMGLRNLRIILSKLNAEPFGQESQRSLLRSMKFELASVHAAMRQVVDTQRDLINAIRLEFDDTRAAPCAIIVDELIRRAVKSNQGLAGSKILKGTPSTLSFTSDERWVERILNNLVVNAIWHSDGDRILVGARKRKGDIAFEVRDNGFGMTPTEVVGIFDPVARLGNAAIGQSSARSGLGLYNVRLLAERLGGSVECISSVGRGTLFRVTLPGPVDRSNSYSRNREIASFAAAASEKFVAVLSNDVTTLRTTEQLFDNLGVELYADLDPLRWLSAITDLDHPPDMILMDVHRKGWDCSLHLEIIRRKWPTEELKIILLASQTQARDILRLSKTTPVLSKPLSSAKVALILEILSCQMKLPNAGFL